MKNRASALIVARPGWLRDGLQAIVAAIPQIEAVDKADDLHSALRLATEYQPTLVLLDIEIPDDKFPAVLQQVKAKWAQARCIVLTANTQQQQIARAAGADGVLLKGLPAAKFFTVIEGVLGQSRTTQ